METEGNHLLKITLLDTGQIEVWSKIEMSRPEFAGILRQMADSLQADRDE